MHKKHLSLLEAAPVFGIPATSTLSKWEKIYYEKGPQGLREWKPCKKPKMNKERIDKPKNIEPTLVKDIITEVKQLRMENEFLKTQCLNSGTH